MSNSSDEDTYQTIKSQATGYFMEKRSKFYAFAFPVSSEDEIKIQLAALRKEYYDARHHVFAWILGKDKTQFRINDDGEPQGSSAKPIYGQLLSNNLTNILVVVIRYFGGIKLGVPGLINAYRSAASDALENAEIITKTVNNFYNIHFDYAMMNDVMKIVKKEKLNIINQNFDNQCNISFQIRQKECDRVMAAFKDLDDVNLEFVKTE